MDDELALYNKVGDLYLKVQNVNAAVEMYERAVNRYTESGFPNNAIALCNKILRSAPGRNHVYLKLAQLMVQRGFVAEAKKNFVEYAERMSAAGKLDEAFAALKRFADISPENEEIRLMLAEQLKASARDEEAREQIEKLMVDTGVGSASSEILEKVRAVDPEYDVDSAAPDKRPEPSGGGKSDLIFISLDDDDVRDAAPAVETVETTDTDPTDGSVVIEPIETESVIEEAGIVDLETTTIGTDVLDGIEPTATEIDAVEVDVPALELEDHTSPTLADDIPALEIEATDLSDPGDVQLVEIAVDEGDEPVELPPLDLDAEDLDVPALDVDADVSAEPVVLGLDDTAPVVLPAIEDLSEADDEAQGPDIGELEQRVAQQPDSPLHHRQLAEALLEVGERDRALEELNITLDLFQNREEWGHASGIIDELLRLEPHSVVHHQKRVEIAFRGGDRGELITAYLDLAGALFRDGDLDKAEAIYRRVLEHDPGNAIAENALATVAPAPAPEPVAEPEPEPEPTISLDAELAESPPPPIVEPEPEPAPAPEPVSAPAPAAGSEFVDLGEFIMGDDDLAIKDTRMKIEEDAPTGDEDADFDQMLQQFKRGIEENLDDTDGQAHYDLGVAFKEMGLVDEAIGEFQKSLRAPETRLQSAEMLGHCFMEKGQIEVASTVLRRAIEADNAADEGKIGLLYWLGRCEEDNGRPQKALKCYQRVFAVDVNFQDVGPRVDAIVKAGS